MGENHVCALSGTDVYCWGDGGDGQVGNGEMFTVPTPTKVLSSAAVIAAGFQYSCAVVLPNLTLSCWGLNNDGQFGDGTTNSSTTPTPGGMGLTNLDVGLVTSSTSLTTCAANASGVYCWGQGPLGTGSPPLRS